MEEKERRILIKTIKALARLNMAYRIGALKVPEWVFAAINRAKKYYNVNDLSKIK